MFPANVERPRHGGQAVFNVQRSTLWQRWRVEGRTWAGDRFELGFFFGRTSTEAIRECRRRKGELCAGLKLEAEARL